MSLYSGESEILTCGLWYLYIKLFIVSNFMSFLFIFKGAPNANRIDRRSMHANSEYDGKSLSIDLKFST
jgi:hypothetical protein